MRAISRPRCSDRDEITRNGCPAHSHHGPPYPATRQLFDGTDDYLEIFDDEHSITEERFLSIGSVARGIVVVVWTESAEDVVRIISARPATRREQELFHDFMENQ